MVICKMRIFYLHKILVLSEKPYNKYYEEAANDDRSLNFKS